MVRMSDIPTSSGAGTTSRKTSSTYGGFMVTAVIVGIVIGLLVYRSYIRSAWHKEADRHAAKTTKLLPRPKSKK